ncbi:MAG: hypothetical protein JXA07_11615 [Spirochaetes bacterium]|nr:hypothetical protein [Spirochaetota bacterium]
MMKLIYKSAILVSLAIFTIFAVIYLQPVDQNKYLAATIDKHRILASTQQPRMIFVGDSNLAFGLDSAMVERATGYNVVNMGLHGGLGLNYYMDELKPHLKRGDVVIIIIDYQNYFFDGSGANTLVEITIFNPGIIRYYSAGSLYNFIVAVPLAFQRRLQGAFSSAGDDMAFMRSAFNEHGDNVAHLKLPQPKLLAPERPMPEKVSDGVLRLYNEFYDEWTPRGIRIYLSFSPLLIQDRDKQMKALGKLYKDLVNRVKIPIIGLPTDFMYPADLFYDNIFHLNGKGRELRTKALIRQIKKVPELAAVPKK